MKKTPCGIPGCDEPAIARQMCEGHYQRWYRDNNVSIVEMQKPLVKRPRHGLPVQLKRQLVGK